MKRFTFAELAKRNGAECTVTFTTTNPERYLLACDFDRLRTEGRERVARELQRYDHGLSDPLEDYLPEADRILSALFDEVVK